MIQNRLNSGTPHKIFEDRIHRFNNVDTQIALVIKLS